MACPQNATVTVKGRDERVEAGRARARGLFPSRSICVDIQHGDGVRDLWYVALQIDADHQISAVGPDLDDVLQRLQQRLVELQNA